MLRFVVRPVAWLSLVLYPVGRIVTYLSMGIVTLEDVRISKGDKPKLVEANSEQIVVKKLDNLRWVLLGAWDGLLTSLEKEYCV
ncbi:hypothetical protein K1719_042025 [Acacia pycnantha]|nr:hypothetical protein K1719_042025 [Acacia pycnantha]